MIDKVSYSRRFSDYNLRMLFSKFHPKKVFLLFEEAAHSLVSKVYLSALIAAPSFC